jgi:hypothetical protein
LLIAFAWPGDVASQGLDRRRVDASTDRHADSSMLAWTAAVADALHSRLPTGVADVRLDYRSGRGVDTRKVSSVFRMHLQGALRRRDIGVSGKLTIELSVSLEGSRMWAVGLVRTSPEQAFAVSWPVDRELEALLGAKAAGVGGARWRLERLGTVPAGVLDLILTDLDGDGSDDIVLLGVDGVRTLKFDIGDARPTLLGGPFALPTRPWPRTIAGRLAPLEDGLIMAATTAGHRLRIDPRSGDMREARSAGVPLLQPADPARATVVWAEWLLGGPNLCPPRLPVEADLEDALPDLPEAGVRDLQRFPNESGAWIWIDADGVLGGRNPEVGRWEIEGERFGDRILLAELDGGGRPELVTSGAVPLGEPDQITIHRLDGAVPRPSVLFRGTFAGTIRAMGAGDLDFDGRIDIVLVEEDATDEAVLWRVERTP